MKRYFQAVSWRRICVVLALLTSGCHRVEEAALPSDTVTQNSEAVAEIALVNLAHRKFGEDSTYRNEQISAAGGYLKVCGEVASAAMPTEFRPFIYSLEVQHVFEKHGDTKWINACEFAWPPGAESRKSS